MKEFRRLRAPIHKPTEAITPKKVYDRTENDEELKNALEEYYIKQMASQDTTDDSHTTRDEDSME